MMNTALFDDVFLNKLFHQREQELYAKITALTYNEYPIEAIEGKVSGGSINVDGDSIIRRTCSINLIAPSDLNINEFNWGVKNKFKLEIGLRNVADLTYDNIIWFPQGIFLITDFSYNLTTKKCDISIKGKDKMCLLNGEVGGIIPQPTEFHIESYYDLETDTETVTDIPIKTIIQEMVKNYGDEQPSNIILNGIEDAGLELLEYRGTAPMFLLRSANNDVFENITFNSKQECYYLDSAMQLKKTTLDDEQNICYDNLVNLEGEIPPTKIVLTIKKENQISEEEFKSGIYYTVHKCFYASSLADDKSYYIDNDENYFISDNTTFECATVYDSNETYYSVGDYYYVAKFDCGACPGYRLTDLTYAGDLIANPGDSVTSILDKIKTMLGDFEYFYNLDGKFVFQRKEKYRGSNWYGAEDDQEVIYNDATLNMNKPIFSFLDNELIISLKNNIKIGNVKNDYSVWGSRKTSSGTDTKIHARYAIDKKPQFYKAYNGHYYISDKSCISHVQKKMSGDILDNFTPMIEVGNISQAEFENDIYYKANLQYYIGINQNKYEQEKDSGKFFVFLKNYIYDSVYDSEAIYYQLIDETVHIVDWREIIYQMAIDYRRHYHDSDFLYCIAQNNNNFYPSGITGYERYYTDLLEFWRQIYNPNPKPNQHFISAHDANTKYKGSRDLYVTNSFRKLNDKEQDQYLVDLTKLYILDYDNESKISNMQDIFAEMQEYELNQISRDKYDTEELYQQAIQELNEKYEKLMQLEKIHETPEIIPFLGSKYCHLNYNEDETKSDETYFFQDNAGKMNDGTEDINLLNSVSLNDIYLKERGPFITLEKYDEETGVEVRDYYYVKGRVSAGDEWPELKDDQIQIEEEEIKPEEKPDYSSFLYHLYDEDGNPIYDKNNQLFLIQKIGIQDIQPKVYRLKLSENNRSMYQYWVYKYPFGTNLGDYPDDYSNYAALAFQDYLNEFGWNNLYIRDSSPIRFSDLDQHIQRLYYKRTENLSDFIYTLQYDNFNKLRIIYDELAALLPTIRPLEYSSFDTFNEYIKGIMLEFIGEYSVTAESKIKFIYEIEKALNETEKTYINKIQTAFKEFLDWLEEIYPDKIYEPYYKTEIVQYQTVSYDFNIDSNEGNYWSKMITDSPENLNFWFDFINGETSFLSKYSIQTIGPRPKVVNDTGVKAIYYKEVPNIIFVTSQEEKEKYDLQTGYNYIQLPQEMQSIFVVSSRGKSATQAIEDLIYAHCYASETTTISTIPIYHLQPNNRIYINDKINNLNSDYLVSKISIPLEAKKQMSITATKVIPNII